MSMAIENRGPQFQIDYGKASVQTPQSVDSSAIRVGESLDRSALSFSGSPITGGAGSMVREKLHALANDPAAFGQFMEQVFGAGHDRRGAEELRGRILAGDFSWFPAVKTVSREALQGANGAYDAASKTILMAEDLSSKPGLSQMTFAEELGHHIDTLVNRRDTAGDEGEMFRRVLSGEQLSHQQVASIRSENDHGRILVDGKVRDVEFFSIGGVFKKIGGAIKKGVSAVSGAVSKVGSFVSGAVEKGVSVISGAVGKVGSFIGGIANKVSSFVRPFQEFFGKIKSFAGKAFKVLDKVVPLIQMIPGLGTTVGAIYSAVRAGYYAIQGRVGQVLSSVAGAVGGDRFLKLGSLGKLVGMGGNLGNSIGGAISRYLSGGLQHFKPMLRLPGFSILQKLPGTLLDNPLGKLMREAIRP